MFVCVRVTEFVYALQRSRWLDSKPGSLPGDGDATLVLRSKFSPVRTATRIKGLVLIEMCPKSVIIVIEVCCFL